MKHFFFYMVLLSGIVTLNACSYHEVKNQHQGSQRTEDAPLIDFEMVRSQVLANPEEGKCTQCHAWANSYAEVSGRLSSIIDRINRAPGSPGFMPKNNPPINQEMKDLLFAWIEDGAPEFVDLGEDDNQI